MMMSYMMDMYIYLYIYTCIFDEWFRYIHVYLMSGLEAGPETYFENTSIDEKNEVCIYIYI
jgi:hypothetical protein